MKKVGKFTVHKMDEVLDEELGKKGTPERDAFDSEVSDAIAAYQMGEAIKAARENANLTQEQLGERLGVKKARISKMEKGYNLTLASVGKVFRALGLPVALEIRGIGSVAL